MKPKKCYLPQFSSLSCIFAKDVIILYIFLSNPPNFVYRHTHQVFLHYGLIETQFMRIWDGKSVLKEGFLYQEISVIFTNFTSSAYLI